MSINQNILENNCFLNEEGIRAAIKTKDIIIYPFSEEKLTPVGYNLTYSKFIVSLKSKNFIKIDKDKSGASFFHIKPQETALILTEETISVSEHISGTFHSKVSLVSKGLGHVSTTLDPLWQGQLLIPMNNPTNKKIKVYINNSSLKVIENDYVGSTINGSTFITLLFYYSKTPIKKPSDNKSARTEILEDIIGESQLYSRSRKELAKQIHIISSFLNKEGNKVDMSSGNRENNVGMFEEKHNQLINLLNANYPSIEQKARWISFSDNLRFIFCCLLACLLYAFIVHTAIRSSDKNIKDVFGILVSTTPAILLWILNQIKESIF